MNGQQVRNKVFNTVMIGVLQIKITMRHHITAVRLVISKREEITRWRRLALDGAEGTFLSCLLPVREKERRVQRSCKGAGFEGRGLRGEASLTEAMRRVPKRGRKSPGSENVL